MKRAHMEALLHNMGNGGTNQQIFQLATSTPYKMFWPSMCGRCLWEGHEVFQAEINCWRPQAIFVYKWQNVATGGFPPIVHLFTLPLRQPCPPLLSNIIPYFLPSSHFSSPIELQHSRTTQPVWSLLGTAPLVLGGAGRD